MFENPQCVADEPAEIYVRNWLAHITRPHPPVESYVSKHVLNCLKGFSCIFFWLLLLQKMFHCIITCTEKSSSFIVWPIYRSGHKLCPVVVHPCPLGYDKEVKLPSFVRSLVLHYSDIFGSVRGTGPPEILRYYGHDLKVGWTPNQDGKHQIIRRLILRISVNFKYFR